MPVNKSSNSNFAINYIWKSCFSNEYPAGLTTHCKYIRIATLALVAQWIEHLLAEQRAVRSNRTEGAKITPMTFRRGVFV